MKRTLWIILFISTVPNLFSQVMDSAFLRVQYLSKSKNYTDSERRTEDFHYLDIGKEFSKFYSHYNAVLDSVKQSLTKRGLSAEEVFLNTRSYKQGSSDVIIKDYKKSSLTFYSKVIIQDYKYTEDIPSVNWELGNDTLTVLGHLCYSATTFFRGREWRVWYTQDIPSMDGPWKLSGLPGLILKAEDSLLEFSYEAKGIYLLNPSIALLSPASLTSNSYIETDGKTFLQIKRKSIEDLRSSIAAQGMTILSVTDDKGLESQIPKRRMNSAEEYN